MRLDKFIFKSTDLSKEQAQLAIEQGTVRLNDSIKIDTSFQVHKNNSVKYNDTALCLRDFRYIMMNKPSNMICSNIDEAYPSIFNLLEIEHPEELHIAGRLDANTTGLVLITDDGHWSFNITRPEKLCEKVYRVRLSKEITQSAIEELQTGVKLQGHSTLTAPAKVETINQRTVLLTITEGRFHQVKQMFASVGNRVKSLHRERIGAISLDVDMGEWRYLTTQEQRMLGSEPKQSVV